MTNDEGKPPEIRGRTENGWKITHMVAAAPGWWARIVQVDGWVAPVACWVVAEDAEGYQQILGVDPTVDDFWPSSGPIAQSVRYFYDPGFDTRADDVLGTSDPGPEAR